MPYQPSISKFFKSSSKISSRSDAKSPNDSISSDQNLNESVPEESAVTTPEYRPGIPHRLDATKSALNEYIFAKNRSGIEPLATVRDYRDSEAFSSRVSAALSKRASGVIDRDCHRESSIDNEDSLPAAKRVKLGKLTPLDQQVKDLKLQHMDKVLAVRVGYKYKFFAMDAVVVSQILQIMLIKGKLSLDDSNPDDYNHKQLAYCSIPENRLQVHLQRLLHHNLRVGVVEQSETQAIKKISGTSSGVFRRQVDKVFTRATFAINETFSGTDINHREELNTIWAMRVDEDQNFYHFWILSVQLTGGEIIYDQFSDRKNSKIELDKRVSYLKPIEVVSNLEIPNYVTSFFAQIQPEVQFHDCSTLIPDDSSSAVFKELNLGEEFKELRSTLRRYLENYNTEKILDMPHVYKPFSCKISMLLSPNTLESLEIFENQTDRSRRGSLLWLLDHTRTPYGYRLLREWISKPLIDRKAINERLDAIECLKQEITNIFMEGLGNTLKDTPDFLRNLNRITYGQTSRKEVYYFLKHLDIIAKHFTNHHYYFQEQVLESGGRVRHKSSLLTSVFCRLDDALRKVNVTNLLSMINVGAVLDKNKEKRCVEFFNLSNYDKSDVITSKLRDIENVREELQRELDNIRRLLKRPRFLFKDEIEYLIEVRNSQLAGLPNDWVKVNDTKTLSRFRTPETTKLVDQLEYHKGLLTIICEEHFKNFLNCIGQHYELLKEVIDNLAMFDCILSLAAMSFNRNYVRPKFNEQSRCVRIRNGRNPIIESLDVNYVANDVHMKEDENKLTIITGPNMGGKSSFIRQVALISILAQIGSYVPADSAELPIFESIFTRIGAHDNLIRGNSTFKVEMLEMLDIIKNSGENSLLLLDEVGRGTGTTDGISISYAIINYFLGLEKQCPFILFITHYPILGAIKSPLLDNYHMAYIEEKRSGEKWPTVVFLYKLRRGPAHDSYGLNVARLARIPTDIINKAYEVSEKSKAQIESDENLNFTNHLSKVIASKNLSGKQKVAKLLDF
ncbi:LANO_0A00716g1_1 [Lachancea nothofagi CBS 11611]|uniref:DNA mismatch repair protein MSH3 n=1 Tax=Lachancea nothofagi CBS 11611 TaxID=1266666 RepID=A0A1G4ILT6_9SACH|nr:LANO_0A00716g1_1 [Lachancea nothofagi CBS 11611]